MNAELIKAWSELAWPVLAAVVLFALLPTLIRVGRSRAFTIKYGGMEISVQEASDQLRKQVEDLQNQVQGRAAGDPAPAPRVARAEAAAMRERSRPILWVDDKPRNNAHEIAKLQHDGWEVVTVDSTRDTLSWLERRSEGPALIISDMARLEGIMYRRTAGLELLREIRSRKLEIPVVIYASADAERDYAREVRELGGSGITSSPLELFRIVESVRDV